MSILESYPKAKVNFLDWMITTYGKDEYFFDQAPFEEQCRAIARYLGYPIVFPSEWTNTQLERKIHDYLYLCETNLRIYPYGVPDPIKKLEEMDYAIRAEKFPDKHGQIIMLPGLNAALVKRTNYRVNAESIEKEKTDLKINADELRGSYLQERGRRTVQAILHESYE